MTTIITRLYPDMAAAKAAVDALLVRDHDPDTINVISGAGAGTALARMRAARVAASAAARYAPEVEAGRALLIVAAPFNPIGTARDAIRTLARHPSLDVGVADEDVYLREQPRTDITGKIDRDHSLWMTRPGSIGPGRPVLGGHVSPRRERTSAIRGGAYMSTKFWPMRLLSRHKDRRSAIAGGWLVFGSGVLRNWTVSGLFGVPTLTDR